MEDAGDEIVALYDADGRPAGSAPRSLVRRDNLHHGATAVVVRNRAGDLYVHRRTETKDVYPGMHDCCAGGVLKYGERPLEAATRELAEELGVTGVVLYPVTTTTYRDQHTSYVAFVYETRYDGPIRWQPEEVAWGTWMSMDALRARLADPGWPFVPDSRALIADWLGLERSDTDG